MNDIMMYFLLFLLFLLRTPLYWSVVLSFILNNVSNFDLLYLTLDLTLPEVKLEEDSCQLVSTNINILQKQKYIQYSQQAYFSTLQPVWYIDVSVGVLHIHLWRSLSYQISTVRALPGSHQTWLRLTAAPTRKYKKNSQVFL